MPPPEIDAALVRRLIASQFPQWASLEVSAASVGGWDNRTYRLGDELSVRLPSGDWYALEVAKEQEWLPRLAPLLPLPIPTPVARGVPGEGYPYEWSVNRWITGEPATTANVADLGAFAADLAGFLVALRGVDAVGGPAPGPHNWFRGGPLTVYADETERALETLAGQVDVAACRQVWEHALASAWPADPVWFHGDVATGNLLVREGRLAAVIDFGTSGVGDPACDVVVAWTLLDGRARPAFRQALGLDAATWSRGRGWALWKALITLADDTTGESRAVIEAVLADHADAT
ncbi:aminoglycoside phosphotransferase family protein [uncultured Friedmanniella sp.]|uniref:aminoglycoside phosphotransferase family protein n=1 Tax=uncultured Friedmanniella sp. TaxID=335381 RepID=UPI0035CB94B1